MCSSLTTQPLTASSPELPDRLWVFAAVHTAMRRDAARLSERLPTVSSTADALALVRWWSHFHPAIVHHHEAEDDLVWPELEAREPAFHTAATTLHRDHELLDEAMDAAGTALAALSAAPASPEVRDSAIEATNRFSKILSEHLDREEAAVFHRLARFDATWHASLERRIAERTPLSQVAFALPWVLDELPPERARHVTATLPAPIRLLNVVWRHRYRAQTAALRGGR